MKSRGYTVVDILLVIVVLGVCALVTIPNMSLAFRDNKEELYKEQIDVYLKQAKLYGEEHKDLFQDNTMVLTLDDLINEGYIGSFDDKIYDIRDGKTILNSMKIRIIYNEEDDTVKSEIV